ncbi:MAG: DUF547 domain-containing protein [Bacteroidetes bacterium]|nr:DUF547 domain-containing protein [Bacteroidota bacterium]
MRIRIMWPLLFALIGFTSEAQTVNHLLWTNLLQKHVDDRGWVDYRGFQEDRNQFNEYLKELSYQDPDKWQGSKEQQMAFWINAYNAFTIQLILDHYPVNSIRDIGGKIQIPRISSPWDMKFIEIGGKKYDLNNIEHGILRKEFNDPRIHFAVVCASFSCPRLRNEAYSADNLELQLEEDAHIFINDSTRNSIQSDKLWLSKIFSWYKGDFTRGQSLISFLNQYTDIEVSGKAKIDYMPYNWRLNEGQLDQ